MENRNGLVVDTGLTPAAGEAEREAAVIIATAASPVPLPVQLDGKHRWSTSTEIGGHVAKCAEQAPA